MNITYISYICIPLFALIIDFILGDPQSSYHPVVIIGDIISYYEKIFYYVRDSKWQQRFFGFLTVIFVLLSISIIVGLFQYLVSLTIPIANIAFQSILLYFCISPSSLDKAATAVYSALRRNKINKARYKLSMIVGRDTKNLDNESIIRATVETVSESIVDGIISPLIWYACFGVIGAVIYRAINTMDSMLGHKNERYRYFGTAAARLDDIANFIPARISYFLIASAAYILRKDWRNALKIGKRDARKHPSPNSGYPEASIAGALNVQLGGINYYQGVPNKRSFMGDPNVKLHPLHIRHSIGLMYITTFLGVILTIIVHSIFFSYY